MHDKDDEHESLAPNPGRELVGYGRPPVKHRFKPGESGSPRGRPKGRRNLAVQLRETYTAEITVREGSRKTRIPRIVAIVRKQIDQALRGDPRVQNSVLKQARELGLIPDLPAVPQYDLSKLTDEELDEMRRITLKMTR